MIFDIRNNGCPHDVIAIFDSRKASLQDMQVQFTLVAIASPYFTDPPPDELFSVMFSCRKSYFACTAIDIALKTTALIEQ